MKKKILLILGVLFILVKGFSQNKEDDIPQSAIISTADKLAIVRHLNFEFTHLLPYNFTSEQGSNYLPKSRVNSFFQARLSANFNFIKRKTWLFGATLAYRYNDVVTKMTDPFSGNDTTLDDEFHYFFSSVNFSFFNTLFRKRTIYTSSFMIDGSGQHIERIRGIVSGVIVLIANQRTKLIVGALINIDPSVQIPIIPIFTYEHKFNNGLIADITLPKGMYLKKYIHTNGRLSFGAEMDRISFYLYNIDGTPQKYEYRQLDVNSGLIYEHAVGNFLITTKTGVKLTPSGRLFRKEDSFAEPVYQTKPDPTFYFNLGISLNPFVLINKN